MRIKANTCVKVHIHQLKALNSVDSNYIVSYCWMNHIFYNNKHNVTSSLIQVWCYLVISKCHTIHIRDEVLVWWFIHDFHIHRLLHYKPHLHIYRHQLEVSHGAPPLSLGAYLLSTINTPITQLHQVSPKDGAFFKKTMSWIVTYRWFSQCYFLWSVPHNIKHIESSHRWV